MALFADYTAWLQGIRDWIGSDEYSDAQIATFLSMAEMRLNRELNAYWMEGDISLTVTTVGPNPIVPGVPIPIVANIPDFNKIRLVVPNPNAPPAVVLAINEFKTLTATDGSTEEPYFYAIDADKLFIFPITVTDQVVEVLYYKLIPGISMMAPDNIFTTYYADILLMAACLEAAPYQVEDERIPMWENKYASLKDIYNAVSSRIKAGSTPLKREIKVYGI